jgi:hypothetical protein
MGHKINHCDPNRTCEDERARCRGSNVSAQGVSVSQRVTVDKSPALIDRGLPGSRSKRAMA